MTRRHSLLVAPPIAERRNEHYPVRAVVAPQPNVRKMWQMGPVLDQRQTSDCTGFAWAAILMANPNGDLTCSVNVGNAYGHNHTARARTGRGLAQIAVERGAITSYAWAEDLDDVRNAVIANGPVQTALPWHDSMFYPDAAGRLIVKPDADPGYHAFVISGYDPDITLGRWRGPAFKIRNSWGADWGTLAPGWRKLKPWRRKRTGDAWITLGDFDRLVNYAQGTCVPIGKTGVKVADLLVANSDPNLS